MDITTGDNNGQILFTGVYVNPQDPIWSFNNIQSPANLEVSTLTVNSVPAGNILLTHNVSSAVEYNAPILFQRPPTDINEPVEALMMNTSVGVPTKPVDGEYITALKDNQTVYDDIAVAGLQIFGNQTVGASSIAYIDGIPNGDMRINVANGSLAVSSLKVSTLFADTVVSTTSGTANSYRASIYMSTPVLYTNYVEATDNIFAPALSTINISTNTIRGATANFDNISTNYISTNDMYASTIRAGTSFVSSANISSLNAGNFGANRIDVTLLSSLTGDITFNLVSTLSLFGNVDVNLGLGNQLAGLIGGAASQGLGVALGGAALATGAVALITGRTSGGVNSNVFQTVNGTTQLQFSTIGTATTSVFLDTNSAAPGTTPALETSTTINVPAGAYCVRSVSDPLNINNNVSTIQSFGQWVPIIQGNPTLPSFTTSTLQLSTIISKSAEFSTLAVSSIGGNQQFSSIQMSGNLSSTNYDATFSWGAPNFETSIRNQTVRMPYVTLSTLNVLGDTQAQQVFGLGGNFNTLVGSNQVRGTFVTGSNWVSTPQLTVSSINGAAYPPPNVPAPSTLFASSINLTGNISSTNANATFTWGLPGLGTTITNTTVNMPYVTVSTLNVLGDTQAQQVFGLSGNFNTLVASNTVNTSFVTGSNWVSTPALTVSSINGASYPPASFVVPSSFTVSTLIANSAVISSLSVSSIGGNARVSSIQTTGNILSGNPSATLTWGSPGFQTILSQTSTVMANARAQTMTVTGDTFAQQVFGASGNFNTVIGSNQINGTFITGSNWISTPQLTVSSINGNVYPPPNVPTPSTIFASSINATGNISTANLSVSTLTSQATANFSSINLLGDINTSNALATANFVTLNTSTLNASSMTSIGSAVSSMIVSTINGVAYPPPNFGLVIPSTIFLSTVNVNGNVAASNPLGSFGWPGSVGQASTIISQNGITTNAINANFGTFSTFQAFNAGVTGQLSLGGNVVTNNPNAVASFANVNASTITAPTVSTNTLRAATVSTTLVLASTISTNNLRVNNYPGTFWEGFVNSLGTSSLQIPRPLPGGGTSYQYFSQGGIQNCVNVETVSLRVFGAVTGPLGINGPTTVNGDIVTNGMNADTVIARNTISTVNLNVAGSIKGALNINGFTTMSNVQANNIAAISLTASTTVTADVLTGRVIQATENLTSPLLTLQNLNVQQTANISTGVVSSLFTQFINNLPYPPQVGVTGAIPSTMLASTVFINGGLTVSGLGQNFITRANISSLSSVSVTGVLNTTGLLNASTVLFNGGMTNTGNLPIITSNLSAVNINNVSFINGQVYPPPIGSVALQSTLFLSSVFVNGGLTMSNAPLTFFDTGLNRTNGNIYAASGTMQIAIPEVGSPGGSAFTITAGSTLANTLMFLAPTGRVRFTSSMTVRDPVAVGTPSQAFITTYVPGSEAPAGSVITANVSTPIINTSSIIFNGSGARINGGLSYMNIYSDQFNIYNSAGDKMYLNIEQGTAAGYVGSTFYTFGQLNNPQTAYITAGNLWTYNLDEPATPPSGQIVTSNISTVNLVASTISGQNISGIITGLVTGNVSTPTMSVSSINDFTALPPVSGNIRMTLDTTNGAGGFGSFQIQPQSSLYIKASLDIGSVGGLGDTLRRYGSTLSIGSAQVVSPIILSADSIVSTANIAWGFAKDGSPPTTTSLAFFINNLSTSKTNVKTTLGSIGLPNSELYSVLETGITPAYLTITNTTNSIVYVEGVPQYASATTTPYGI